MHLPLGHMLSSSSLICHLNKSLYGLNQTSRQWYAKLSFALHIRGYSHSPHDHCLFLKKIDKSLINVAIYADDVLVTGNDNDEIAKLKTFLHDRFQIKDLGLLDFFLGLSSLKLIGVWLSIKVNFLRNYYMFMISMIQSMHLHLLLLN